MIYLITGQPGHGKTLRAMELALEFQAAGREVYVAGVRGLKTAEAGFLDLEDARKWPDLPDGAVIVLDECYSAFPRRPPGAKVPPHVELMATHRHRGFDFILICQQAKQQIDGFLLGLVDRHEHVRRKFGLKSSVILTWDKFSDNTNDSQIKKLWKFPASVMKRDLYESTVQDTTQRRIPWFVKALPVAVLVIGLAVWRVWAWFQPKPPPPAPAGQAQTSAGFGGVAGGNDQPKRPQSVGAFMKWMNPRVPGQPWTAPMYDQRAIVSAPRVFCISIEDGGCNCMTEQGTRYEMPVKLCRAQVYNGGYYDPTLPARDDSQRAQQAPAQWSSGPATAAAAVPAPMTVSMSGGSAGLNHGAGVGGNYTGPEYRSWDATPSMGGRSAR